MLVRVATPSVRQSAPRKVGRPTAYRGEEHCEVARKQIARGRTMEQLARLFRVSKTTLDHWCAQHPAFLAAIEEGREQLYDRLEASLYQRAMGYTWKAQKPLVVGCGQNEGSRVEIVEYREHVPPDYKCLALALTNRRAKRWSEKRVVEQSDGGARPLVELPTDELMALMRQAEDELAARAQPAQRGDAPAIEGPTAE